MFGNDRKYLNLLHVDGQIDEKRKEIQKRSKGLGKMDERP